jgi:hypothetical protein
MVERRADRRNLFLGHGKHLPSMEMPAAKGKLIIGGRRNHRSPLPAMRVR